MAKPLPPELIEELRVRGLRSPSEYGRIFLPAWFPTKMPWVHRGMLALLTRECEFLLDFGPEVWRDGTYYWTPEDLAKIETNFLVRADPTDEASPMVPVFRVERNEVGHPVGITMYVTQHVAVAMPRGFSKTTLVNLAVMRAISYALYRHFLYIGETEGHAAKQLGTVRAQIADNDLHRVVFGNLKPERNAENKWTDTFIEPLNGVMVGAVGRGGQVRGLAKHAIRPDWIIFDDIEDEESVANPQQMSKSMDFYFGSAIPALKDMGTDQGVSVTIGTILKTDALLPSLAKNPGWMYFKFAAIDLQGEMLWAHKMDAAKLEQTKRSFASMGKLPLFYMEYMSDASFNSNAIFPANRLIYLNKGLSMMRVMSLACDPAISEKRRADMCAFAVVGMEPGGACHVVDSFGKVGMQPDEQVDKWFELHFRWLADRPANTNVHGIEAIAYQRALISMVQARMYQESQTHGYKAFHTVIPIMHGKQGKTERVEGILQPRFMSGYISFAARNPDMETQLLEWPKGKRDLPDVAAMAIKLLDPAASMNTGVEFDPAANDAEPLERVIGGDPWGAP